MIGKYFLIVVLAVSVFSCKTSDKQNNAKEETKTPKNAFVITTDFGEMKGLLYDETPLHRDNFIKLINEGFYDSLLFHRVIKSFMIQGGDPASKTAKANVQLGNGGPGYTIPAEFNTKFIHKKGALSAARMGDNANPKKASSGSQFYIVQGMTYDSVKIQGMEQSLINKAMSKRIYDYILLPECASIKHALDSLKQAKDQASLQKLWIETQAKAKEFYKDDVPEGLSEIQKQAYMTIGGTPHLDRQYTVFGEIYEGLNIIDSIANVKGDRSNRPLEDVRFTIRMIKE